MAGGMGSIPANSDTLKMPSFRRWRFEMKLSPLFVVNRLERKFRFSKHLKIQAIFHHLIFVMVISFSKMNQII
jgi:hypothetical protein